MMPDEGLPAPDLIVLLDMDPKAAAERGEYGEERYEKIEFQTEIRKQFNWIKDQTPSLTWKLVDASQSPDDVATQISSAADNAMGHLSDLKLLTQKDLVLQVVATQKTL